ncbi:hypothetical protein FSP39_014003 [Pinctada imbricata]|uniref:RNA-binding protein 15 n=1 Tax=Pinctada imbricata TaxID=66713 RepID=A0AA88YN13_PINIB|nr:hypothetical protein FSP39_014003 [Pinctada imbricata]
MKRSVERDLSPGRMKRSRYIVPEYSMRDKSPPDFDRMRGREPKPKYYDDLRPKYRDDRIVDDYGGPLRTEARVPEYRSLCLSNISSKIPDHVLKEALYREFKKFGEFNVNVTYSGEVRVAYINFRYPEDAREAKHAKQKLMLFERPVRVESVYHKKYNTPSSNGGGSGYYPPRDHYPPPGPPRGMSPPPFQRRPSYHQGPDPGMPPKRDYNPQYQKGGGGGGGGSQHGQDSYNRRAPNEKFPYHLDHIPPEDDDKATRTLFVGNLDYNIDEPELRGVFDRYGGIEEIDIKRPALGKGNAYAFIKFLNLDCAHRAKVSMSGEYIGRFQCKIGYGKVTPSTCLWVGGLGSWVTHQMLEREFDRFGVIDRIVWPQGKNYAYVLYDNIDAAQVAINEMRGAPLGGNDRRLRVDFADVNHVTNDSKMSENGRGYSGGQGGSPWKGQYDERRRESWERDPHRNPDGPREDRRRDDLDPRIDDRYRRRSPDFPDKRRHSPDRYDGGSLSRENRRSVHSQDGMDDERRTRRMSGTGETVGDISEVENIQEMARCLQVAWNGAVILKSSAFPARMHVVSGDVTTVDTLMRDPTTTETPTLKIKQRLRLDQSKLEDVGRRVSAAGRSGHCILLALPSSLQNYDDPSVQQRPLKNLVTYLRQKDAAGVISLPPYNTKDKDNVGVLYAFPPCQFGYDYLSQVAPRFPRELVVDDYLIIVVIRGAV